MTQEDKQLLLVDLCGKLPYGVKVLYKGEVKEIQYIEPLYNELKLLDTSFYTIGIEEVKPYLRPMSSMTEEEKMELLHTIVGKDGIKYFQVLPDGSIDNTDATIQDLNKFNMHWVNFDKDTVTSYIDWLNEHHFDYRGLIPNGLAISTDKFNPYNA